nr:retrovirus-related Pol polyprotein from transposon TNT 1-94 [Tanacetum cinerariifolium]
MSVLLDDQMNFRINCLTAKSTWDDLILYHEGPSDVKESRVIDKSCVITPLNSKKKWLSFCQSLRNTNHVNDYELASLFGKLKYEENLIHSIYETEKNKSLVFATPLSTDFFSTFIVQDFQDSPDDEEDRRSIHEYLNDLEEEYKARSLLAKSKRIFKKGTQRFSSAKATDQTECHKCGMKGHFHKPELRPTKDFEAKYNKVKAKLALLSLSALASKALMVKNKGLIAEAYEWDEKEESLHDNEMVEVKVLMALAEKMMLLAKKVPKMELINSLKIPPVLEKRPCLYKSSTNDTKVSIPGVERPWLSEAEGFIFPNHDTGRILPAESQRSTTNPLVAVIDSSASDYDYVDEFLVCSTPLHPLKKLDGAEPISGPKTIKSILKSKSTVKAETIKGIIINEPSSALAKDNRSSLVSKVYSAPVGKLKSVKIEDDPPLAIHLKSLGRSSSRSKIPRPSKRFFPPCRHCVGIDHLSNEYLYYPICGLYGSYDHDTNGDNKIISRKRDQPKKSQDAFKRCESCGSLTDTITDHYAIEWFKRGEALQAKKDEVLKSTRAESSNSNISKPPTKRHMTGVKSYLHKYVEQPGPKVVFGDDSTCTTEAVATACYTQNRSTIMKRHLKTPYEIFHKRIPNINFLHVFGCPIYIDNHKNILRKFDEKADDGYLLGYSLVSKAFRVFNPRRQQTKETYYIIFNEIPDAIKFLRPSVDNINIAKNERYPPNEYLHPYEPSQRNKGDETGIVINKAKLIAQGHNQEEGIDYDETFALVTRLEAIRIFLAFATYMNFIVYQMNVKSPILNDFRLNNLKEAFQSTKKICQGSAKKYEINGSSVKTPMVPPNNLGPDFSGKAVNETQYRGFDLKGYLDSDYASCKMDKKEPQVPIVCDNTSAIAISNNLVMHSRTKHTDIRYHFIRDHILKGD